MPETDRLRGDIDEGRTHDKVPFPDPAAAPLGTDDEAAGTPAGAARRGDAVPPTGSASPGGGTDERGRPYDDKGATVPATSFVMAVAGLLLVVVLGAAVVAAMMMG